MRGERYLSQPSNLIYLSCSFASDKSEVDQPYTRLIMTSPNRVEGTDPFPKPIEDREIIEIRKTSSRERQKTSNPDIEAKPDTDIFVEDTDADLKRQVRDVQYTEEEDGKPRTGLRRLLRRNPSMEFVREVAQMDELPLDPVDVKRVSSSHARHPSCYHCMLIRFI